jgi:hypothetical protein
MIYFVNAFSQNRSILNHKRFAAGCAIEIYESPLPEAMK